MEYVIVGCCHAGTVAATTILHYDKTAKITIVEKNDTVAFLSCGIALAIQKVSSSLDGMFYNSVANLRKLGCSVLANCEVVDIDFRTHTLCYCQKTDGATKTIRYDKLLLTTGSIPFVPIKNVHVDNTRIFLCKDYNDAKRLVGLKNHGAASISIVGAGYIGIELAQAFLSQRFAVNLIERESRILARYFCDEITDLITDKLRQENVLLLTEANVLAITVANEQVEVQMEERIIKSDYCIVCAGFKPNTEFILASALRHGVELRQYRNGALLVNEKQETSVQNVYAAGDSASHISMLTQEHEYVPLATTAVKQAIVAGINMSGGNMAFPGQLGTSVIKVFGHQIAMTGISNIAGKPDLDFLEINDCWRPEFIPENNKKVKVIINYQKSSRKIVGAQILSEVDVMQMINILSVAIQNKMTLDQLMLSDFFFNPWYGKPLHVIQAAIAGNFYEQSFTNNE